MRNVFVFLSCVMLSVAQAPAADVTIDSSTFGGLEARALGPATMSGRITSIDAVAEDPLTIYIGSASGGVWKSTDGGVTYEPVFDDHIQSIGAVRIDPNDSETVWVGTGEGWTRNSVSVGDGVYKSTDGGDSWTHLGLAESERITRLLVDPEDSDRVFVCATGQLWSANEERGVYRTTDGGETWEQVLAVDARHRLLGSGDGPAGLEHPLCRYVAVPSLSRLLRVGRSRIGSLPFSGRWRHLAGDDRGPSRG